MHVPVGRVGIAVKGVCAICQRTGNTNSSSPPYPLACRPWALLAWRLMRAITTGKIKHNVPEWRSWNLILHAGALPSSLLALAQALCLCGLHTSSQDLLNYCLWLLFPGLSVLVPFVLGTALCFARIPFLFQTHCPKFHTSEKVLSSYSHASLQQLS